MSAISNVTVVAVGAGEASSAPPARFIDAYPSGGSTGRGPMLKTGTLGGSLSLLDPPVAIGLEAARPTRAENSRSRGESMVGMFEFAYAEEPLRVQQPVDSRVQIDGCLYGGGAGLEAVRTEISGSAGLSTRGRGALSVAARPWSSQHPGECCSRLCSASPWRCRVVLVVVAGLVVDATRAVCRGQPLFQNGQV
jgi:hypothetical protein